MAPYELWELMIFIVCGSNKNSNTPFVKDNFSSEGGLTLLNDNDI